MPHPEKLGNFRILKPLGRGGMGTVYAAVDETTGERVALKLIAQQLAEETRFRERFTAEIKALHRLQHVGIVRFLHSYIDEDGQIYYTMELVEGETLHARIRREKKMDWRRVIDIAIQICSALKHAHDAGVIHRDLKPANLMLTADGSIKLVDFGIAKVFGDNQMTHAGSVLGTADYMAPEQAHSVGVTHRTDLYALGNVMYAMLTGRPPFTGKKVTQVIESLKRDPPVPLDLINPELPEELVELIHQLLEKDPSDRPPTALVVMKRLQSMRAGLERAQTVIADEPATDPGNGNRPPGKDESGESTRDSGPTDMTLDAAALKAKPTNPAGGRRPREVNPSAGGRRSEVDPNSPTAVSHGSGRTLDTVGFEQQIAQPTRREAVTDFHLDEPRAQQTFLSGESKPVTWTQWAAIAGMIGMLGLGVALFIYAVLPPSADELFQSANEGDSAAMRAFLNRFPEDRRADQIRDQWMDRRTRAVIKRLTTQEKIDITPLEPAEQAFLHAMNVGGDQSGARDEIDSAKALQQWLDVYGALANQGDPALAELIELVRYQRDHLDTTPPVPRIDPRAKKMIEQIRDMVGRENVEVVRTKLTALINLHANDDWAEPVIDEAKRQLASLEEEQTSP